VEPRLGCNHAGMVDDMQNGGTQWLHLSAGRRILRP